MWEMIAVILIAIERGFGGPFYSAKLLYFIFEAFCRGNRLQGFRTEVE